MILLLSIGLSIVLGLLTGGRLSGLARVPFRLAWLTFVALGLQVISVYVGQRGWLPGMLLIISYSVLLAVVVANIRTPGLALLALGLVANLAVISANGGYMPVTSEAIALAGFEHLVSSTEAGNEIFGSKDIVLPYSDTRLWPLSDILIIRWPVPAVASLGDLVLAVGAFWFIQAGLRTEKAVERLETADIC
jgi:hypothetical protein